MGAADEDRELEALGDVLNDENGENVAPTDADADIDGDGDVLIESLKQELVVMQGDSDGAKELDTEPESVPDTLALADADGEDDIDESSDSEGTGLTVAASDSELETDETAECVGPSELVRLPETLGHDEALDSLETLAHAEEETLRLALKEFVAAPEGLSNPEADADADGDVDSVTCTLLEPAKLCVGEVVAHSVAAVVLEEDRESLALEHAEGYDDIEGDGERDPKEDTVKEVLTVKHGL